MYISHNGSCKKHDPTPLQLWCGRPWLVRHCGDSPPVQLKVGDQPTVRGAPV